jgi:hypothetical protein
VRIDKSYRRTQKNIYIEAASEKLPFPILGVSPRVEE